MDRWPTIDEAVTMSSYTIVNSGTILITPDYTAGPPSQTPGNRGTRIRKAPTPVPRIMKSPNEILTSSPPPHRAKAANTDGGTSVYIHVYAHSHIKVHIQ